MTVLLVRQDAYSGVNTESNGGVGNGDLMARANRIQPGDIEEPICG